MFICMLPSVYLHVYDLVDLHISAVVLMTAYTVRYLFEYCMGCD